MGLNRDVSERRAAGPGGYDRRRSNVGRLLEHGRGVE